MPCLSKVMSTSIVARGPSSSFCAAAAGTGGVEVREEDFECFDEDRDLDFFLSFSFSGSGDGRAGGVAEAFRCGANALASTFEISSAFHSSFMPSRKRSSSRIKTSSFLRRPSVTAALSNSVRLVAPIPSLSPVLMQRILRWFCSEGCVRA